MKIGPWGILAACFCARLGMGFQFQLIASTAPQLQPAFALTYGEIGTLIGLYMLPGVALALPASWLGARFEERRLVIAGLALMVLGTVACALAPNHVVLLAGRFVAGFGAILMNVLLSKLVLDWFVGGSVVVAMAIFVNSWPVGVGLALLVQAPLAVHWGWPAAFWSGAAEAAIGLLAFALVHRPAPGAAAVQRGQWPGRAQWPGLFMSAGVWASYNVAFALVFSFGIPLLVSRGNDAVSAGALISLILWVSALCIPFAAALLQRLDGARLSAPLCLIGYAAAIFYFAKGDVSLPALLSVAVIGSLPAGANMALVANFLTPQTRTWGMGLFYVVYYAAMAVTPAIAGATIDLTGDTAAPLVVASLFAVLTALIYFAATLRLPRPQPAS